VPSSRDMASYLPALYLLQQGPASEVAAAADSSCNSSECSDSEQASCDEDEAAVSGGSSSSSSTVQHWLAHTKPRKGSAAQVLLRLRALTGSDLRDSQQVTTGYLLLPTMCAKGVIAGFSHRWHVQP